MDLLAGKFILILVCHLMMTFDFWLLDCKINSSVFQDLVTVTCKLSIRTLSFLTPNFLRVIEHLLLTWQMGPKTLLIPSKEVQHMFQRKKYWCSPTYVWFTFMDVLYVALERMTKCFSSWSLFWVKYSWTFLMSLNEWLWILDNELS